MVEVGGTWRIGDDLQTMDCDRHEEAMAHLPSPDDAGDRFSDELTTFCEEFSPTTQELRRLLAVKLGATNWHKVSSQMPTTERRRVHGTWLHEANEQYRSAVTDLTQAMKAAFPARVDTAKINGCCQVREESVRDYHARLFEIFRKHSGMAEPEDRGTQPGTWECHLQSCFLNGLRPEIAQAVKASYIEWQSGRLTTTLAHAVHAEEQLLTKKDKAAKVKGEREMQLAVVQIKASTSAPPAKQNWTNKKKRGYQGKWKCGLCASNEHEFSSCTKCRLCKNDGHWAQDCPEARKADWNERNGEQERRGRVTGIQPATKKGSKNLLTHTHNTLTYTDSNTALCNEEMLANRLCVTAEVLNNAICNEEHACKPFMCDCWSFE